MPLGRYIPDEFKISRICPILIKCQKKSLKIIIQFRFIPVISKLFELLLDGQLSGFFEQNYLLSYNQFGFRKGMSTTDAIDSLLDVHFFSQKLQHGEGGMSRHVVMEELPVRLFPQSVQNRR